MITFDLVQVKVQGEFSSSCESIDRNMVAITTVYQKDGRKDKKHITLIRKRSSFKSPDYLLEFIYHR